jgi:hypothetical protein
VEIPFEILRGDKVPIALDTFIFWDLKHEKLSAEVQEEFDLLRASSSRCFYMMSPYAFAELTKQRWESRQHDDQEFQRIFERSHLFLNTELPACPSKAASGGNLQFLAGLAKEGDLQEIVNYHKRAFTLLWSMPPSGDPSKVLDSPRVANSKMFKIYKESRHKAFLSTDRRLRLISEELDVDIERVQCYRNWAAVDAWFFEASSNPKYPYNPESPKNVNDPIDVTNFRVNILPAVLVTENKWGDRVKKESSPPWNELVVGRKDFFKMLKEGEVPRVPRWSGASWAWPE